MTTHYFEHPLNEKTRMYLRVESLLNQLHVSSQFTDELQHLLFFRSLFDLLEIFEQIQLKSELAKDIEKQRQTYRNWRNVEGVDQEMLDQILSEVDQAYSELMGAERFGQSFKEDRFLSMIRQRFNLPGGACCFDLPALHHWLHRPVERKIDDASQWMRSLEPLANALELWLKLTRETGQFRARQAQAGFFQSDADEANILRLKIPVEYGVYPMISGHKNRFAIKFMDFESGQASTQNIEFDLAVCG
ncbi:MULTISPECIES: cell division protein ZapD [Vibrio]|uniref:Cell division protein ZapD n=1 Tax=Vibrio proteolyticus NBRC 13287 TaxID=1219065 RepID=U3BMG0_VIBPR|nr:MULTISPECIES: cell division protein ZapD [Vibrio]NAW59094.1 cell division protein ZapD [Vibrio sp. V36_P2S2PM302]NAX20207.1 cell division protein ZapD [Vibrio sp. V39_P1S14PM300]NAX24476.1 cell division protein ZapD [Vibrio sp. V38_P2S17PM301]NAX30860.1 cell division protein ZapD [Vibrio sp. V37_P2S8PM304]GAD67788.1 cell division protein ZapD [Vibrio proteolyticus NBRC 13287]